MHVRPESLVTFLHIRGIAIARQCVFNLILYNLIIHTATLSNWIMYLCYLYLSFCCNMMCVSHPVRLLVCNTFHFVLVVFGTCLCTVMCVCFEILLCLYLYSNFL
jgi:hypothetical protein